MLSAFKFDLTHLRGDIYGGLTAGVVAIPLALAFGVASGLGPMAGMYGAIIVGFFAAWFGGTPTNVSGPTGPMVVVLAGLFASLSGDVGLILTAVVLAGGASRRMGRDKIAIPLRGRPLLAHALGACAEVASERIVVGREQPPPRYEFD